MDFEYEEEDLRDLPKFDTSVNTTQTQHIFYVFELNIIVFESNLC